LKKGGKKMKIEKKNRMGRLFSTVILAFVGIALVSMTASAYIYNMNTDNQNIEKTGNIGIVGINALTFDNPNFNYIKIIDADASTVHRQPGVNPGGTMIVTAKTYFDGSQTRREIFLYNMDGSGETMISFGDSNSGDIYQYGNPVWADDGHTVGFIETHNANPNKIIAYDTAGTLATSDDTWSYIYQPVSPDDVANFDFLGTSTTDIVFWTYGYSSTPEQRADLFIWDGTTLTDITNSDFKEYEPISNPSGDKILYWSGEVTTSSDPGYEPTRTTHLLSYIGGTWQKDVGFTPIADTYWGTFTSDAGKIAVTTHATNIPNYLCDLLIYNADGTFDFDLTGPGFPVNSINQNNFFGTYPDGPVGSWVFGSNEDGTGRDVYFAYPSTCADEVYVDDDWAGSSSGDVINGHIYGYDAFSTIQTGVDAVCECGIVYVNPGTYTESIYTVGKSLKLLAPSGATIRCPTTPHNVYVAESSKLYDYCVGFFGGTYNSGNDTVWGSGTITVEMSGFTIDANNKDPSQRWASILCRNVNTDTCDGIANIHDNELINIYVD
jgi:hypothetical protein